MIRKIRIGILISGRGSNMNALVEACTDPAYPGRIVTVISNRPQAPGLALAQKAGIPTAVIDHTAFPSTAAFEESLHNHLIQNGVELVCLAGFMRLLGAGFVLKWTDRILNIHPSLLPDYPGLQPQARALADNRTESGCTVHIVTPEMDAGPILVQRRVPILPADNAESLSTRILEQEHLAYPEAVRVMAERVLKNKTANYKTEAALQKGLSMENHNVSVNPEELARARAMWKEFAHFTKYAIIVSAGILVLMAIFLL